MSGVVVVVVVRGRGTGREGGGKTPPATPDIYGLTLATSASL